MRTCKNYPFTHTKQLTYRRHRLLLQERAGHQGGRSRARRLCRPAGGNSADTRASARPLAVNLRFRSEDFMAVIVCVRSVSSRKRSTTRTPGPCNEIFAPELQVDRKGALRPPAGPAISWCAREALQSYPKARSMPSTENTNKS